MESTQAQRYTANLFFGGLAADIDPELIDAKTGAVLESHCMQVSNIAKNKLRKMRGDAGFVSIDPPSGDIVFIGGCWLKGYIVYFYHDTVTEDTYVYANNLLIGQHADFPSQYFDIDVNEETTEMFITDNVTCPIVLNLQEMIDAKDDDTYFVDFDPTLYRVNKSLQLNQPVFVQLEDLGAGSGLKSGSYAYALCYSSASGEDSPWGPLTPYIPVPENASRVSSVNDYYAGPKVWGGNPSLTAERYGIRLRIRVANISGFDYIKIKRLANNTGQPIAYTPTPEYLILTTAANGSLIDIKSNPYSVIEFIDSNNKAWATLDDSVVQVYSTIKKARTIRYFDRRIILGGIEYEPKIVLDENVFIEESDATRIAFPVLKELENDGFTDIYNQVYYKSHRLGEKYGYGVRLFDEQGNGLFTIPLRQGTDSKNDFTNYKFPERREKIPQGVKRIDYIMLTTAGINLDIGQADIVCDGVSRVATFRQNLVATASDFVTAYAAGYLVGGVVLTSFATVIYFTAAVAGVDFTGATSITTKTGGNLAGSVGSTAGTVGTSEVDYIEFQVGVSADVTCEGITRTIYYADTLSDTINNFVNSYAYTYLQQAGVSLAVYGDKGISFTGPGDGIDISVSATGDMVPSSISVQDGNLGGSVSTETQPNPGVKQIDRLQVSGTIGQADVTCNTVTRLLTLRKDLATTVQDFCTAYGADYLAQNILIGPSTFGGNSYIYFYAQNYNQSLTTSFTSKVTSNLTGTVESPRTQDGEYPTRQVDKLIIAGGVGDYADITCQGITRSISFTDTIENTAQEFVSLYGWTYAQAGITIGYDYDNIIFTGPEDGTAITTTGTGPLYSYSYTATPPSAGQPQIDTITLSGTTGNAWITCNGVQKESTFITSLANTVSLFVSNHYVAYEAAGIIISQSGSDIIFTSINNGPVGYGAPTIVNAAHNLTGTPVTTQAIESQVAQVDYFTPNGNSGSLDLTCDTVTGIMAWNASYQQTVADFITSYSSAFSGIGITIASVNLGGGYYAVSFTGPSSGVSIDTSWEERYLTQGNPFVLVSPSTTYGQIDVVTLSGTGGNVKITCHGIQRGVTFDTSLTITATKFVQLHAADYLPYVQVTSGGADITFERIIRAEENYAVTLTGTTVAVNAAHTLQGTVTNYRANASGGGEVDHCENPLEDATVESYDGTNSVYFVYDPVKARLTAKTGDDVKISNIAEKPDPANGNTIYPYGPITPTGRGSIANNNNYHGWQNVIAMNEVAAHTNHSIGQYGEKISTVGLRIGGIDVSKLPSNITAFSVVRTPAAGRVVCQGIAVYALTEQADGATNPSLVKAQNKVWFYSPELDQIIGTKSGVYEDMKANPEDYQVQLVAPCGFFTDVYSSHYLGASIWALQDMVSMPICGAEDNARTMFPPDHDQSIGVANYITFGKWRNIVNQATLPATLIFDIQSAQDVPSGKVRAPFIEVTLGANLYYTANVKNEECTTADSKAFHEPWYIVNIIQNKQVPNENINVYNEIGHSIRIESVIGISNGESTQIFGLVEERLEDVLGTGNSTLLYRYIWVDGKPWLCTNGVTMGTYLATLEANGKFTPTGGLECYGVYTMDGSNQIIFDKVLPTSGTPVVPESGARIVVKYNSNSPIEVFLGDTYVAPASFLAVDTEHYRYANPNPVTLKSNTFRMEAPMPQREFKFSPSYLQARQPNSPNWEGTTSTHHISYVRQWLIYFTCESTVNLPLAYKNFFPHRNYTMRPYYYQKKAEDETITDFFSRVGIYEEYNTDYPDEYLNWDFGGFATPAAMNYDYEKQIPVKVYSQPKSGVDEITLFKKRFHWSTQNLPGYLSNKVFVPTNVYDLKNDKSNQISILYDVFSERGSNLYVITDRGVGMLLTDKTMITTAEGNNLAVLAADASLIKGEIWLNGSVGCPKEFWRGKSEGNVKLPNNVTTPLLVFPTNNDIVMLSNNNFIQIASNNREDIMTALKAIDPVTDFTSKLYSVIDEEENKLMFTAGGTTFVFNFDINNWDGHILSQPYDKSFYARYLEGITDRCLLVHPINDGESFGLIKSQLGAARVTSLGADPYVIFSVTPALGSACDFIDMFLSCDYKPDSLVIATDRAFTDASTISGSKIVAYSSGLFHVKGLARTVGDKRLIGKTLFVKVIFSGHSQFYDLKLVKTGYKEILGG